LKNPVVLLANGQEPSHSIPLKHLDNAGTIVCVDGGYEIAKKLNIQPTIVIGDFDSTNLKDVDNSVRSIKDEDQDKSDLEKAIELCISEKISDITVIGSTGMRDDHNLANTLLIIRYLNQIEITIATNYYLINAFCGQKIFHSSIGTQISLISIEENNFLTTSGLEFDLDNEKLKSSTNGISNTTVKEEFAISSNRPLIIFRKI